jgi:hypothetical protein
MNKFSTLSVAILAAWLFTLRVMKQKKKLSMQGNSESAKSIN